MAFLNPAVAEGLRIVARQITTSVDLAATPTTGLGTSTTASSTSSSASPTDTTVNGPGSGGPPPGTGSGNGNGGGGNGSNSSPLLFFVALGFGVVFTNLWIIVGVKYCFRYNARSRAMRMNEDGEPINMENMPRPHRRRREKKLMTMDEVNEKFPMLKYKNWVASRAQEGLPTRGGVSPPSRAGSVRDADGVAPELPSKERMSTEERPTDSATSAATEKNTSQHVTKESTSSTPPAATRASTDAHLVPTISESATLAKDPNRASHDDDEDEDEHIDAALPPECMGTSGDTCAICIDTLEDDDDVRGLTCGHAFHAVCLDPWLTSRRACCPLCKADYYTPKPRTAATEGGEAPAHGVITVTLPNDRRMNMPNRPPRTFLSAGRFGGRHSANHFPTNDQSTYSNRPSDRTGAGNGGFFGRFRRQPSAPASPSSAPTLSPTRSAQQQPTSQPQSGGMFSSFRGAFPAFRVGAMRRSDQDPVAPGADAAITPSNLEAGVRS